MHEGILVPGMHKLQLKDLLENLNQSLSELEFLRGGKAGCFYGCRVLVQYQHSFPGARRSIGVFGKVPCGVHSIRLQEGSSLHISRG